MILAEIRRLEPDVLTVQEVSLPFDNASWLAERLDGYEVVLGPKSRATGRTEALAIVTRLPVVAHDVLELGAQDRVVQRAIVRHGGETWEVANAHLHWSLRDDEVRVRQVRQLMDWLRGDLPTVVCGDFNAPPHWRAVATARERFSSAYATVHGREPDYTFPTPLWRGLPLGPIGRRVASAVVRPVFNHRRAPWRSTLDYIFVDERVTVLECQIAFDTPAADRPWLYPSDHLGLNAVLSSHEPLP